MVNPDFFQFHWSTLDWLILWIFKLLINFFSFSFSFAVVEKFRSAAFSGSGSSSKSTSSQSNRPSTFGDTAGQSSHDLTSSSSLYIRSVNSSEVIEGGDAVLRCEFERHNSLFAVAAWFRDDGRIFLPVEQLVDAVKRSVGGSGSGGGGTGGGHESFGKSTWPTFRVSK